MGAVGILAYGMGAWVVVCLEAVIIIRKIIRKKRLNGALGLVLWAWCLGLVLLAWSFALGLLGLVL